MHGFGKSSQRYTCVYHVRNNTENIAKKKPCSQTLSSQNQQDKEYNLRIQNLKVNMQNVFL